MVSLFHLHGSIHGPDGFLGMYSVWSEWILSFQLKACTYADI